MHSVGLRNSSTPCLFEVIMNLDLVMKFAHNPVRNYAIPGLTSWMISNSPEGNIRMFDMTRDHIEPIVAHSHRFNFHCIVLEGEVENILFKQSMDGDLYSAVYQTYNGSIGSYKTERSNLHIRYVQISQKYNKGDQYSMYSDEIHSIRFKKGTKVLFFEGPDVDDKSIIIEPIVDGELIETFKVEPWMFKKDINE
jgi:tetrahydromethanopterin S-methyltransferase subunit E